MLKMVMKKGNAEAANAYPLNPRDTLNSVFDIAAHSITKHTNGGQWINVYDLSTLQAQECVLYSRCCCGSGGSAKPATGCGR